MTPEAVKLCPFCGKAPILEESKEQINIGGEYFNIMYLGCKTLGCFGFAWCMGRQFSTNSIKINVEAWNTRPAPEVKEPKEETFKGRGHKHNRKSSITTPQWPDKILHPHNSILAYIDGLDDGCLVCERNNTIDLCVKAWKESQHE